MRVPVGRASIVSLKPSSRQGDFHSCKNYFTGGKVGSQRPTFGLRGNYFQDRKLHSGMRSETPMVLDQLQARPPMWASAEDLIDEARNGRMFILVDDEDRENEGDLIVPAQMATPDAINFMARHGRGLVCLAITAERARVLQLELQPRSGRPGLGTAFTASIEARQGVTTGISAADRACTIAAAIDASRGAEAIVSPGHVFPLIGQDGGVLVRAGHTEASIDVARLAGLNPSAVICEIMNDDGTMARRDDILAFAAKHSLKVGTIRDLIAYRHARDHLLEVTGSFPFVSRWGGTWMAMTFNNRISGNEHLAVIKGELDSARPTPDHMFA